MPLLIRASAVCVAATFLTASLQVSALQFLDAVHRTSTNVLLNDADLKDVPTFYMYDDPAMTIMRELRNCKEKEPWASYVDIVEPLLSQLEKHERRVTNGSAAKWFIVPFDFDLNDAVGPCNGTTPSERVNAALDVLEASPFFKNSEGRDHVMVAMIHRIYPHANNSETYFPNKRRPLLQNMVIAHYLDNHLFYHDKIYGVDLHDPHTHDWLHKAMDWRCTWLLPVTSPEGLWKEDQSFEEWNKRPNTIFFRGHNKRCKAGHGASQSLRETPQLLNGIVPNVLINNTHADTFEQYVKEITSSKFCLVMRCDDPQTSRMVDALAAGCIPVIISEGLGLVAKPFSTQINWDAFSVNIDETVWMKDPVAAARFAYNWSPGQMRQMQMSLQAARAQLLWNHPRSQVTSLALRELARSCTPQ